ncbi:MAG: nuclear transport factor 2 family protein [Bacteroidetes bacterium]|nr:nuclear transport factor 2 family protein [Bacteroidota bacterium]
MTKRSLILLFVLTTACQQASQPKFDPKEEEAAIRKVLDTQVIAWNNGDLVQFMEGYWKSDSLQFMSSRGINRGWQQTLEGYQKGYPDRAAMGTLSFDILQVTPLSPVRFLVSGRFHLTRAIGDAEGIFTLIFRKENGKWVAMYDHTS